MGGLCIIKNRYINYYKKTTNKRRCFTINEEKRNIVVFTSYIYIVI